jgi:hypothetical protein
MSTDENHKAEEMIKISGMIEHLQIGIGRVNLLSGLSGSKAQNIIALADAIGGHIGAAAMVASSSNHEIGELEYFACYIEEDLVQGVFPNVTFREGDEVEVVVQQSKGKNYVRAITKITDDLMWIPLMMEKGIGAIFLRSLKQGLWIMLFSYASWGVFTLIDGFDDADIPFQILTWSIPAVFAFIMGIWDFMASYSTGMQSTNVFRMLGLPDPYWIDLAPYSLLNLDNDPYGECVYRYRIPPPILN